MATNGITAALGRWSDLLAALGGLEPAQLNGRHQPCPLCGGRDRYRFDDLQGSGLFLSLHYTAGSQHHDAAVIHG